VETPWLTEVGDVASDDRDRLNPVLAFERDPSGELLVVGFGETGGGVYRPTAG
jgi:hypothetical protein